MSMNACVVLEKTRQRVNSCVKDVLATALSWENPLEERIDAARSLGELGDREAVIPLGALLGETEGELAEAIEEALEKLEAIDVILRDLNAPAAEVRQRAAQLLTILRAPSTAADLTLALSDPDPRVREESATALYELKDLSSLHMLTRVLFEDEDPDVRSAAAQALGELHSPEALLALEKASNTEQDDFTMILIERSICRFVERLD